MSVIINTVNNEIVNQEFETLKEATAFLKTLFKEEELTPPTPPQ